MPGVKKCRSASLNENARNQPTARIPLHQPDCYALIDAQSDEEKVSHTKSDARQRQGRCDSDCEIETVDERTLYERAVIGTSDRSEVAVFMESSTSGRHRPLQRWPTASLRPKEEYAVDELARRSSADAIIGLGRTHCSEVDEAIESPRLHRMWPVFPG